jgi:hypothetical protein
LPSGRKDRYHVAVVGTSTHCAGHRRRFKRPVALCAGRFFYASFLGWDLSCFRLAPLASMRIGMGWIDDQFLVRQGIQKSDQV